MTAPEQPTPEAVRQLMRGLTALRLEVAPEIVDDLTALAQAALAAVAAQRAAEAVERSGKVIAAARRFQKARYGESREVETLDQFEAADALDIALAELDGAWHQPENPLADGRQGEEWRATPPPGDAGQRYRHRKRGTTYQVIGVAEAQSTNDDIQEGDPVVVYRSEHDGSLWVRPTEEFHDGRFERLTPSGPPGDAGERARDLAAKWARGYQDNPTFTELAAKDILAALQSERTAAASQALLGAALIVEDEKDRGGSLTGAVHRLRALATPPQESA